jgi:drug/metabolite transporter (DMT)-like permease
MGGVVLIMGLIIAATRPARPSRDAMLHSAITGLLVHGCYLGGVFVAIDRGLPAGFAALVVSLQPILSSTLASRLLGERVALRQWAGLVLGVGGVYFVVHGHTGGEAPLFAWLSASFALIGMTIGTLYQKRFGGGIEWRVGFFSQYVAAMTLFALGALLTETVKVQWTPQFLLAIGWLVFGLSLGAIWLLYFLIRHQAAARVLSLFYLTPPVTALMACMIFVELVSLLALFGMAVCVAGVALVNWRSQPT